MNAMTTTTRKTTKKAPKGTVRTETLAQFSAALDDHAGQPVGFDVLVRKLFTARAQIKQLEDARKGVFEHVKNAYELGHRVVGGYELKVSHPAPGEPYQAVSSAEVKKQAPAAWRRAQAVVPWVSVQAPAAVAAAVPVIEAPDGSGFMAPEAAVLTHREHPAWKKIKLLKDIEQDAIAALEKLGAEFGWDGDAQVFADGWQVQLNRVQFSAEKLRELEPDVFDRLAVTKVRAVSPRVYIGKISTDEADEMDGE
ncbi:hypothetical protein JAMAL_60 [Mycobacterium phage JAMaL]|uniref:Uncharacterized protein n=1 Tax=Mycobacterium phage JAMaL TaxID=1429905 RepID=V5UPS9_9CAUD|nr:hypothetical protein CH22_gp60 [Mycobacterium phage JAMaL]AHB79380.1 hypothetical protein JAMAL_60 [Mycobacterium phage JAMaL]